MTIDIIKTNSRNKKQETRIKTWRVWEEVRKPVRDSRGRRGRRGKKEKKKIALLQTSEPYLIK
jgi:hypothetical protein